MFAGRRGSEGFACILYNKLVYNNNTLKLIYTYYVYYVYYACILCIMKLIHVYYACILTRIVYMLFWVAYCTVQYACTYALFLLRRNRKIFYY